MSHDLDGLLRASLDADSPDWLDRLVTERVLAVAEQQAASEAAAQARRDTARAALAALQRSGERVGRLARDLLPSDEPADAAPGRVLDDPNGA